MTTAQDRNAILAMCHAIEAGYAAGKSGGDDDMHEHLIELGDKADVIRELLSERRRAFALLGRVLDTIDMTNPEHENYNDSCADAVGALCELEAEARALTGIAYEAAVRLLADLEPTPTAPAPTWRLTRAGAWLLVNAEGATIGQAYQNPHSGTWTGEPWGREIAHFTNAEQAKAHVLAMLAR